MYSCHRSSHDIEQVRISFTFIFLFWSFTATFFQNKIHSEIYFILRFVKINNRHPLHTKYNNNNNKIQFIKGKLLATFFIIKHSNWDTKLSAVMYSVMMNEAIDSVCFILYCLLLLVSWCEQLLQFSWGPLRGMSNEIAYIAYFLENNLHCTLSERI